MNRRSLFSFCSALAVSFALNLPAQDAAKPATPDFKPSMEPITFKDGDMFVFLGDSITHQCLYTQYVEDFVYTRFPKLRVHFHNSGVGGDRASDALARFDDDVASFKPNYVTILLGMNDGGYTKFNEQIFNTYEKDMTKLLEELDATGAKIIPMTPTMHDARASRMSKKGGSEPRDTYYNGVLAYYGSWLREQASQRGYGFVDMYTPLNMLTIEQRRKDPKFTMIPDSVHPGPNGQVVMAAAVIDNMLTHPPVSAINIAQTPEGKYKPTAANGKISDFAEGDTISFTFTANALPWVLPPEATDGYKWTHSGHKLSNEKVTVAGLKAGKYELRIDGNAVGSYTSGQLAFGVELEENDKTPEYQQALKVALLNKDRNDKAMRPLRNLWGARKGKRRDEKWLADHKDDPTAAQKREEFDKWLADFNTKVPELKAQVKQYEDQIYQLNQPVPHKYEVVRIN